MLPAPRDPLRPEAVPPEPRPLVTQLARLLGTAGAQAARAIDGSRGVVLAEVGLADGDDVAAVVQLARGAAAVGRGRGEWLEDLVVTLGRTVHVLRECEPAGVVLHARLDPARGDVAAVRRALAAADLQRAAQAATEAAQGPVAESPGMLAPAPAPAPAPEPTPLAAGPALTEVPTLPGLQAVAPVPLPRPPRALARLPEPPPPPMPLPALPPPPSGSDAAHDQQPALVTIDGGAAHTRTGAFAVMALPPVATLPRRSPAAPAQTVPASRLPVGPAVLRQAWASDMGTMRRLLDALHRMS